MKWTRILSLAALSLLAISCSGPQTTTPSQSMLPPVSMSTSSSEVDTSRCRKQCAATTDVCMTSCNNGEEEEACAKAALRCMDGCKTGEVL